MRWSLSVLVALFLCSSFHPSGSAAGSASRVDLEIWLDPEAGRMRVEADGQPVPSPADLDSLFEGGVVLVPWRLGWYPSGPDLRISGRTTFHLPPGWRAITNGHHLETIRTDSTTTDVWYSERAIQRSFCAGPYTAHPYEIDGRSVNVFLLTEPPGLGEPQAKSLVDAIEGLESRFGSIPYPPPSLVEFPQGQESWHAVSVHGFILAETSVFLYAGSNLPIMAHELGHSWWGNLVRVEGPGSLVCNEALAQFVGSLVIEAVRDDRAAAEFLRFSSSAWTVYECARGYFALVVQDFDEPLSELTGDTNIDYELAYSKGPWIFRMLRRRVGDEIFFRVLNAVIEEHVETPLTLDALRRSFVEAAPPEADLESFFTQWLDRTGAPVLEMRWEAVSDSEGAELGVALTVEQIQAGDPFALELDVGLLSDGGVSIHRVNVSGARTEVFLPVEGTVEQVVLDPRHALLIWDPEYGVRAVTADRGK